MNPQAQRHLRRRSHQLVDVHYGCDDTITFVMKHQITDEEFFAQWFSVGPSGGMVTMKVMPQKQ